MGLYSTKIVNISDIDTVNIVSRFDMYLLTSFYLISLLSAFDFWALN